MPERIEALRKLLLRGIKKSKQCSYARRAPAREALPDLKASRDGLFRATEEDPKNAEAWRLLSRAEEALLNYEAAVICLETAMSLDVSHRKPDLKRLCLLKECFAWWDSILLSPGQLRDLGAFLKEAGAGHEMHGRTLEHTRQWLTNNKIPSPDMVIEALAQKGGFTDFQIVHNIIHG